MQINKKLFFVLCSAILLISTASAALAQEQESWSSLKAMYRDGSGPDKFMDIDPWPLTYTKSSYVSDIDAHRVQAKVGLGLLFTCSDIKITEYAGDTGGTLFLLMAAHSDGKMGMWFVDLSMNLETVEYKLSSLDINTMEIEIVGTSSVISNSMLDAFGASEECRGQNLVLADYLGIEIDRGFGDIWNKVKNKWQSMNMCEQMHTVAGVLVCGVLTPTGWPAVGCGVVFVVSGLSFC